VIWWSTIAILTFRLNDLLIIGLLLLTIFAYFSSYTKRNDLDAVTLLFGVTLGKGTGLLLKSGTRKAENEIEKRKSEIEIFILGLVLLLAFASWWHLDTSNNFFNGRWMGIWDNPNEYGALMSVGLLLAIGLLVARRRAEGQSRRSGVRKKVEEKQEFFRIWQAMILFVPAGMMASGLLFSYSRGAWFGTAIGLLYLTKIYGKFKWRHLLAPTIIVAMIVVTFWNIPRTAPWCFQRLDLSHGSVQHRLMAWRAGFEIMWDHPLGVGWDKVIRTYEEHYSPPVGSASAISTNDYLMLGAQLGIPALVCLVTYCVLSLRTKSRKQKTGIPSSVTYHSSLRATCRGGALAMLVEFWFDGGLFKLTTASVFWILLELGCERP
jgi:O-antigen ligase